MAKARVLLGTLKSKGYQEVEDENNGLFPLSDLRAAKNRKKSEELIDAAIKKIDDYSTEDRIFTIRNRAMLFNSLLSIWIMIITLQFEWESNQYVQSTVSNAMKLFLSFATIVMIFQIIEYYIQLVHQALRFSRVKHSTISSIHTRLDAYTVLRTTKIIPKFLLEVLIVLPHPLPFSGTWVNTFGLLMFFRMYVIFKVIRDNSLIYKRRKVIERIPGTRPTVNTIMTTKVAFQNYPVLCIITLLVTSLLAYSYSLYVIEREAQPDEWNFLISCFVIITCMFTAWASDVYDVWNPVSIHGKLVCLSAVAWGLFLLALLIDYIHRKMTPERFQLVASEWVSNIKLEEELRDEAARLIQIVYKQYHWKKDSEAIGKNLENAVSPYSVQFFRQKNVCRRLRKQKKRNMLTMTFEDSTETKQKSQDEFLLQLRKAIVTEVIQALKESPKETGKDETTNSSK